MNTQKQPTILFWLRKNCGSKDKSPIYARITIDGKRCEISTKLEVNPNDWDTLSQTMKGKSSPAKLLNNEISSFKAKLLVCFQKLLTNNSHVTSELLRNEFSGITEKQRMLLDIIRQHNLDFKKLVGKDYKKVTWIKYEAMYRLVSDFVKWKFKVSDISLMQLNYEFITDFDFYLKTEKNINTSTNPKYIKNLQKVIRECVAKEWLVRDPFLAFRLSIKKSKRTFLQANELDAIITKIFTIERLNHVKDIFIFSCYTGLSYIDIFNLTRDNIVIGIDGGKWIVTTRQKTETSSRIPLLPIPQAIIDRHITWSDKHCGKLLPVISNQKMNAYLKEIADCCGIDKSLTFHMARHTFATTVTLTNGVPIESVSKMLGHTKIETTQIYAKVLDSKVSNDMHQLMQKLDKKPNKTRLVKAG